MKTQHQTILTTQKTTRIKNKNRTANKVLPKAGLNGFDWTFVQGSTFVLRLNFCAKIPAFGNTQNVIGQCKKTAHPQMAHLVFADTRANSKNPKSHFFSNA